MILNRMFLFNSTEEFFRIKNNATKLHYMFMKCNFVA